MKALYLTCLLLSVCCAAFAGTHAVIVLRPTASVNGDSFYLGDIATITTPDTAFRSKLMGCPMGRAPLAGLTRSFNDGDVALKLRQAGIDPETLSISGAEQIVILGGSVVGPSLGAALAPQPAGPVIAPSNNVRPKGILIHRGDKVTLVYDADGMVISADVVATSDGGLGDTISLSRDGAAHSLSGIVQDAQTVQMME